MSIILIVLRTIHCFVLEKNYQIRFFYSLLTLFQIDDIETDETGQGEVIDEVEHVSDTNIEKEKSAEETPPYPVHSCLQPLDVGQEYLDTNGKIFCLAPAENQVPKSVFREEGIDAMAFPWLLPDGQYGLSMKRDLDLTPSKYFNVRRFSADFRFARDGQFVFFAQYVTAVMNVASHVSIALRKGKQTTDDGKKVNASMLTYQDSLKQILKSDVGFRFLQPVRGTPPYWERTMKDLYSMIRQIGIPIFFITFSAGETRWNEVVQTLLSMEDDSRSPSDLDWTEKCISLSRKTLSCVYDCLTTELKHSSLILLNRLAKLRISFYEQNPNKGDHPISIV